MPLNSSVRSAVPANNCASVKFVLPSLTNTFTSCTGLAVVLLVFPPSTIAWSTTFDPCGSVAPEAEIVNDPVVSDEMTAPPRSIVSAATNKVCHLLEDDPN